MGFSDNEFSFTHVIPSNAICLDLRARVAIDGRAVERVTEDYDSLLR